jgi:glutathione S-transferase
MFDQTLQGDTLVPLRAPFARRAGGFCLQWCSLAAALIGVAVAAARADDVPVFSNLPQIRNEEPDQQYLARLNGELDKAIADRSAGGPLSGKHVGMAGKLYFAHSAYIPHIPTDVLFKWVDAFKEAGAMRVDMNPGIGPWVHHDSETVAKYDALVRYIHESGMQVGWDVTTYSKDVKVSSFEEWTRIALPVYRDMARQMRPDVFVIVHEPTTLAYWLGVKATPADWVKFIKDCALATKQVSPRTRIGAGAFQLEDEYYDAFAAIPEVDVLTLDIYFLPALPKFARMAATAHKNGKEVYIEETWRYPIRNLNGKRTRDVVKDVYKDVDAKWLDAMALFAARNGLSAVTAECTTTFFTYRPETLDTSDRPFVEAVVKDVESGTRTSTFHAFQSLAAKYGGPPTTPPKGGN